MKLNSISGLTCQVADLDRTVAFYESLGFRTGKREASQATCYVNWFWITFVATDGPVETGAGPVTHIRVDDIGQAYQEVPEAGYNPDAEPAKRAGGGTEFALRDPDGYRLVLFHKK
jgi:catechol 2,3-dioxygenase-like lactoylglutathione lyase family enzyme